MIEKQFVCMKEAAQILGVDSRTMKKILENAVDLNWTRVGGKILINKNNNKLTNISFFISSPILPLIIT